MAKIEAVDAAFGERLRDLRVQKKLSQAELAEIIGVHHTHIGRYERGESRPLSKHLQSLANALGVSIDYLLNGKKEDAAVADLKDREFLKLFERAEKLPDEEKAVIKKVVSALIKSKEIEELAAN